MQPLDKIDNTSIIIDKIVRDFYWLSYYKGKIERFSLFFGPRNDSYPWKWAFWWIEGHINGSYPQKQPFSWTKLGVTMVIGVGLSKGVNVGDIGFFV